MSEIEWLDADGRAVPPGASPAPQPGPVHRLGHRPGRWSVSRRVEVGWVITAVLAVYAPFLTVYRLRVEQADSQQVDGWGRFDSAVNVVEGAGAHGIRFGIVSCAAAALVLLALALRQVRIARGRLRVVSLVLSVVAAGLLVATSTLMFLDLDAVIDSVRSELSRFAVSGGSRPALHVGAGAWTMLAAAAVCLLTIVVDASSFVGPAIAGQTARPGDQVDEPPLTPGHELL